MRSLPIAISIALSISALSIAAQEPSVPSYFQDASKVIGTPGKYNADGSYRINIPRNDVVFKNSKAMTIPSDFGLATYAAFSGIENNALVVGDVALLQPEIDSVIDALRAGGIEVVALHNHMTTEEPRLFYLHYQGHGKVADLASTLKIAFGVLGKRIVIKEEPGNAEKPTLNQTDLEAALGVKAQKFASGVLRFAKPRTDLKVTIDQLPFTAAMGVGSWVSFGACDCGLTMVMGDTCCASRTELQGVIDAFRHAGISITAIHNHVFQGSQEMLLLHFDGEGDALKLAQGIRKAWDALGKP